MADQFPFDAAQAGAANVNGAVISSRDDKARVRRQLDSPDGGRVVHQNLFRPHNVCKTKRKHLNTIKKPIPSVYIYRLLIQFLFQFLYISKTKMVIVIIHDIGNRVQLYVLVFKIPLVLLDFKTDSKLIKHDAFSKVKLPLTCMIFPVSISHTLTDLSSAPVTSVLESREHVTHVTLSEWLISFTTLPSDRRQICNLKRSII